MECEICGKKEARMKCQIEDSKMLVCLKCSRYGRIISEIKEEKPKKREVKKIIKEPEEETIVPGFAQLIRKGREEKGLKQEDLAKKINEKASVIHKIEVGELIPPLKLAEKLERFLKIKLIIRSQSEVIKEEEKEEGLTIGDIVKVKE